MRKARLGLQNIEREAERLKTLLPLRPLYDSGWVLSTAGVHTFTHNLGKLPLLWSLLAADDASGTNPTIFSGGAYPVGANWYGFYEWDLSTTTFVVVLHPSMAYSNSAAKWYISGTDYVRLLIWAVEE